MFTNFKYITFFSFLNKKKQFFLWKVHLNKTILTRNNWENRSKSVRPSTVIYTIYITRTDFEHHFSQLFRIRVVLSRWTFHKYVSFGGTRKKCDIFHIGKQGITDDERVKHSVYGNTVGDDTRCDELGRRVDITVRLEHQSSLLE